MNSFEHIAIEGNNFLLTEGRSVFWEEKKALILSDLHLGKSGHFRKSGIGIPQTIFRDDLHRLFSQIRYFNPTNLLVIGDLFHSTENREHELFLKWRKDHEALSIILVRGNHDILDEAWYRDAGIAVEEGVYSEGGISFSHEYPEKGIPGGSYCFSGHVHPGVMLNGMGKQSLRLPCFYFGKKHAILPAYGKFTGLQLVAPLPGDRVFAIVENRVMKISY